VVSVDISVYTVQRKKRTCTWVMYSTAHGKTHVEG
jgi:hypothetical protein